MAVKAGNAELVRVDGVDFYVQVVDGEGPRTIGYDQAFSFDGVRDTISAVGGKIADACRHVGPTEASVEFGVSLIARAGKLTGLLVEADGSATLKVTLTWKNSEPAPADR